MIRSICTLVILIGCLTGIAAVAQATLPTKTVYQEPSKQAVAAADAVGLSAGQWRDDAVRAVAKSSASGIVQIEMIGGGGSDSGVATGVIVDREGLVLTAAYHLRNDPASIFVKAISSESSDRPKRYLAQVVAQDHSRNLTLLQLVTDADQTGVKVEFSPLEPAPASSVAVGQTVVALGKIYDESAPNISVGIVSAQGRIWGKAIQTDAKISKTNYGGPLMNLAGQMIGVLVPLSPDDDSVSAGVQWYDSGIGFAIPMDGYQNSIARMQTEGDLHSGLTGMRFQGNNIYSDPLVVSYCAPRSPAAEAGILPGDEILAVNGKPLVRQSEIRHALGPQLAGDEVSISFKRGEEKRSVGLTLTEKIEPYSALAVGVIPDLCGNPTSLKIGGVIAGSAADEADMAPGMTITQVNQKTVTNWDEFQLEIDRRAAGETVKISVLQPGADASDSSTPLDVTLEPLSSIPVENGSSCFSQEALDKAEVQTESIQISGSSNACQAAVPKHDATVPMGLLVWVPQPGPVDFDSLLKSAQPAVKLHNTIVMIPQSLSPRNWTPGEAEFINQAIQKLQKKYPIDRDRVVIGGSQVGGTMACVTAFLNRDTFRGLAVHNCAMPQGLPQLETTPNQRMLILLASSDEFRNSDRYRDDQLWLAEKKFPVFASNDNIADFPAWLPTVVQWATSVGRR